MPCSTDARRGARRLCVLLPPPCLLAWLASLRAYLCILQSPHYYRLNFLLCMHPTNLLPEWSPSTPAEGQEYCDAFNAPVTTSFETTYDPLSMAVDPCDFNSPTPSFTGTCNYSCGTTRSPQAGTGPAISIPLDPLPASPLSYPSNISHASTQGRSGVPAVSPATSGAFPANENHQWDIIDDCWHVRCPDCSEWISTGVLQVRTTHALDMHRGRSKCRKNIRLRTQRTELERSRATRNTLLSMPVNSCSPPASSNAPSTPVPSTSVRAGIQLDVSIEEYWTPTRFSRRPDAEL